MIYVKGQNKIKVDRYHGQSKNEPWEIIRNVGKLLANLHAPCCDYGCKTVKKANYVMLKTAIYSRLLI